jgi:WD40 repeat protein
MVTAFGEAIDGVDMVWDVTDLSRPRRLSQFEGGQPMTLSPDGRTVATIAYSGPVERGRPRRPVKMTTLSDGDGSKLEELAFSPDGQILATARYDKIFLWDMASPARPRLLRTLGAPVTYPAGDGPIPFSQQDLAFSPGGSILASATGTDQVTLWNVTDPAHAYRMATLGGAGDLIQAFAFYSRGNLLAAVTFHGPCWSTAWPTRPGPHAPPRSAACWPAHSTQADPHSQRRRRFVPPASRPATRWRSPRTGTP